MANLSLGTLFSSHDWRSLEEQAIDVLVGPGVAGKAVVVAAGNSSDNRSTRHKHLSGTAFVGLESGHTLHVPAYTPKPDNGNDRVLLDVWYEGRDKHTLIVRPPAERTDCAPVEAPYGDYADVQTACGDVFIGNMGGASPQNGDTEALVLIDDWTGPAPQAAGRAGSEHGWTSKAYAAGLKDVDDAIGSILDIYKTYKLLDHTMVIVTALNGIGEPKQNGSLPHVPWIASGANSKAGHTIAAPVSILDTGATVMRAFGLETHMEWQSRPVEEIFRAPREIVRNQPALNLHDR